MKLRPYCLEVLVGYQVEMVQQAVSNLGGGFDPEMTTLVSAVSRPGEVQGVKKVILGKSHSMYYKIKRN